MEEKKKVNMQHKLFKAIILIIVAVFFCLIFYFLYIQFSIGNSSSVYDVNKLEALNTGKTTQLLNFGDRKLIHQVKKCDGNILKDYISRHMPCILDNYQCK
jgi:hypothetical protein